MQTPDPSVFMNAEKMGIISVLGAVVMFLICALVFLFKYMNEKVAEKDKRINEMTSLLVESATTLTKMTLGLEANKNEVIMAIRTESSRVVEHISQLFRTDGKK